MGNFKWLQNKEAATILLNEIWPRLIKKNKRVKMLIAGRHSREFVGDRQEVEVGEVDDIREAYQRAHVFIAPFRSGGGSRLKIFEAMAGGLPVVSTAKGVEGIGVVNEKHFLRGETSQKLADLISRLLNDKKLANKIGQEAKDFISENYDWRVSARQLVETYEELTKN